MTHSLTMALTMAEGFEHASNTLARIQERTIEMIDEQSYGDAMDTTEVFEVARDFHFVEDILRAGLKLHRLTLDQRESQMLIGEQIAHQEQQHTEAVKEETQNEPLVISADAEWVTVPLHEDR